MRIRHRPPSIFNLSMVDVLCCALGCVLLLWLWNMRKAQDFQFKKEIETKLVTERIASLTRNFDDEQASRLAVEALLAGTTRDKSEIEKELTRHRSTVLTLEAKVNDAAIRQAMTARDLEDLRALLAREQARATTIAKDKTTLQNRLDSALASAGRVPGLEKDLAQAREGEKKTTQSLTSTNQTLTAREAELLDLAQRFRALSADKTALEKAVSARDVALTTNQQNLTNSQATLNSSQLKVTELEKQLALALRDALTVKEDLKKLEVALANSKANADSRFAGIELMGKKVVFLIDRSGSMLETSEGKAAPAKWTGVVDNVVKVMQSLPQLESYQLVTFSTDGSYPLNQPGQWLRYVPGESPDLVKRTLLDPKHKPEGGTNLYAGFEQAFLMRPQHMDAIYLFSDGLPSRGGIDPNTLAQYMGTEKTRALSDYVRRVLRETWNRPIVGLPSVRIHSIGFYFDSPDVGAFLWALSRDNDGSFVGMSKP